MRALLRRFVLPVVAAAALAPLAARADENGVPTGESFACADNALSTITSVCTALQTYLPFLQCPKSTSTCVRARQEIFTGLTGETASPTNIKAWNGQGVSGQVFQGVGVCLMRDLAAAPMKSHASASLPIGTVSVDGLVDYVSFDPASGVFKGVHRLTAHAPVIGDIDLVTQPFTARPLNTALAGKGLKVGAYDVAGAHALEFEAEGGAEGFAFELEAIKIVTPYGTVSPKPHLSLDRLSQWSLSPYGGASAMTLNPGGFETKDVYGRMKGQAAASAIVPHKVQSGKYPGAKRCVPMARDYACIWPAPAGWDSQLLLGSRNVDPGPGGAAWTAPAGVAFPLRPDADVAKARGGAEKTPNGYAKAGIKIEYDIVGMLPAAILNNGFIKPTAKVFVDPNIAVAYASQFDFWNAQASVWNPALDKGPPAPFGTPDDVDSYHSMALYGGAGVAGRFAFDAGVDLVLHVHISLPWPLDDIDFNILNLHPRAAFAEKIDAGHAASKQNALVLADSRHFATTGAVFKTYKLLTGANVDGVSHLAQCFASPPPPEKIPEKPKATPGDPADLVKDIEMPCNICVGHAAFDYLDVKTQSPLTFVLKTMPAVAEKTPFVSDASLAPADKWVCGGPLPETPGMLALPPFDVSKATTKEQADAYNKAQAAKAAKGFKNAGCYDRCRVNGATGKFELLQSAKSLYAAGIIKDAPNGCY